MALIYDGNSLAELERDDRFNFRIVGVPTIGQSSGNYDLLETIDFASDLQFQRSLKSKSVPICQFIKSVNFNNSFIITHKKEKKTKVDKPTSKMTGSILPRPEVIKRLRKASQLIRLFGETDDGSFIRLKQLEISDPTSQAAIT